MTRENQDVSMHAGETKRFRFKYSSTDPTETMDITNADIYWVLKQRDVDSTILLTKSTASGITVETASGATVSFVVSLSAGDTASMSRGKYFFAVSVIEADDVTAASSGELTMKPKVNP